MEDSPLSGGCQCGAVRFVLEGKLGRASVCHCRMCQKAFGSTFAPLVTARGLRFTRGTPKYFRSSNKVRRGFCADCGTPLTYEPDGLAPEVSLGALDEPERAPPTVQIGVDRRIEWSRTLDELPTRTPAEATKVAPFYDGIVSFQHPDHDTDAWPPPTEP